MNSVNKSNIYEFNFKILNPINCVFNDRNEIVNTY